jgi:probable selenium-dependent hydroxylase accessory protein YqeC
MQQAQRTAPDLYAHIMALLGEHAPNPNRAQPVTIALVGAGGKTHLAFYLAKLFKQHGLRACITTTTKMYFPSAEQVDARYRFDPKTAQLYSDLGRACLKQEQAQKHKTKQQQEQQPSTQFIYQHRLPQKQAQKLPKNDERKEEQTEQQTKVQGFSTQAFSKLYRTVPTDVWIVEADGANGLPIKAPALHEPCIPIQADLVLGVTGAEALLSAANPERVHRWAEFSHLAGCAAYATIGAQALKRLIDSPNGLFKGAPEQAAKVWVLNKFDRAVDAAAIEQLAEGLYHESAQLNAVWLTQLNTDAPTCKLFSQEPRPNVKRRDPF